MTPLFKKFLTQNWVLLANIILLVIFGVIAVYSATAWRDDPSLSNLWTKHIIWAILGGVVMLALSLVDYSWIRWGCIPLYLGSLILLLLVKVVGVEIYGAKSWIRLPGGFSLQPSQLAILSGILGIAVVLTELPRMHTFFRHSLVRIILAGVVALVPMGLVLKEPDLGSASIWGPVLAAMLLASSIPWRYLIVMGLLALLPLPWVYFMGLKPYQQKRITNFIKILREERIDIRDDAYAPYYVQMAVATGGMEGKGFLANRVEDRKSLNRMGFIPANVAMNDYVFAVAAEEHGFRGMLLLLSGFSLLLLQCIFVAWKSRDTLGRLIVVGTATLIFSHLILNAGMCVNLVPGTGVPLPFISYGGTFMVMLLALMGLVQSVWVHKNLLSPEQERSLKKP